LQSGIEEFGPLFSPAFPRRFPGVFLFDIFPEHFQSGLVIRLKCIKKVEDSAIALPALSDFWQTGTGPFTKIDHQKELVKGLVVF
jgi:hypothetical protein